MDFIIKSNSNFNESSNYSESLTLQSDLNMNNYRIKYTEKQNPKMIDSKKRWSKEENILLLNLYSIHGAKWEVIASFLTDRSAFSVKNHFYGLSRKMPSEKKNELKLSRLQRKEQNAMQIVNTITLDQYTKSEEDLIVESFLADELKSIDKMEIGENLPSIHLNINYEDIGNQSKIKEKLYEKYEELKKLSDILEQQILLKRTEISEIPKMFY